MEKIYKIECITNLHVGSGDVNYGVVDNLVQRDAVTEMPTINASGLKGALKEFFNYQDGIENTFFKNVFGSLPQSRGKGNDQTIGKYIFNSCHMIAIPLRSNQKPYFMATSIDMLKSFPNLHANVSALDSNKAYISTNNAQLRIEDIILSNAEVLDADILQELKKDLNTANIVILPYEKMKEMTTNLPVIARNYLENGESKNLWYEEVVPAKSLFWTKIISNGWKSDFDKIESDNVQIGANATIGYGQCKFKSL